MTTIYTSAGPYTPIEEPPENFIRYDAYGVSFQDAEGLHFVPYTAVKIITTKETPTA